MTRLPWFGVLLALFVTAGCGAGRDSAPPAAPPTTVDETTTADASAVPDLARIACDAEETSVLTPRVRPQPDGIHLRFENRAGRRLAYSVESKRGGGRGGDVPPEGAVVVISMPPGAVDVVCHDPYSSEDPGEKERAALAVVDPLGLWTASVLSSKCKLAVATHADYAAGAEGEKAAPVEIARRYLEERGVLQGDDVVEAAGYPDQEEPLVRLARNGETLALFRFMSDGKGGWLLSTVEACTGIGLG